MLLGAVLFKAKQANVQIQDDYWVNKGTQKLLVEFI